MGAWKRDGRRMKITRPNRAMRAFAYLEYLTDFSKDKFSIQELADISVSVEGGKPVSTYMLMSQQLQRLWRAGWVKKNENRSWTWVGPPDEATSRASDLIDLNPDYDTEI